MMRAGIFKQDMSATFLEEHFGDITIMIQDLTWETVYCQIE